VLSAAASAEGGSECRGRQRVPRVATSAKGGSECRARQRVPSAAANDQLIDVVH
jgi:hypothetical protein